MPHAKAKFIAIEGLEGAGKTTAIETMKHYFAAKDIDVCYTREPGGTPVAEQIREILITPYPEESLCAEAELLLMYASRIQHTRNLIQPMLEKGTWVISDRFHWSSLAYQGGGRKLGFERVKQLDTLILNGFKPDVTLYLDITPEIGLKRAKTRKALDRIEQETLDFFERAREVFLTLAAEEPTCTVIDGTQSYPRVQADIINFLAKKTGK